MSTPSKQPEHVELLLWEPSAVNRSQWPITVGVPFPKGTLTDKRHISLWDSDTELPVASRVTSQWPDGSIRWLLLDFQVDIAGNERQRLVLRFGDKARSTVQPACTITLAETDGGVTVDNGDMKLVFRPGGRMPLHELLHKGKSVLAADTPLCTLVENGKEFSAVGGSVKVTVEDKNDLRVVVRCDGKFTADDGSTCLDLTTRVYIFAGKAFLKVYHTITNLEGRDVFLDGLSVRVPTALSEVTAGYVTGQGLDDSIHPTSAGSVSLAVRTVPVLESRYSAEALDAVIGDKGRLPEIDGTTEHRADDHCVVQAGSGPEEKIPGASLLYPIIASGLVCGDGIRIALVCRDFYPQAPKKLTVHGHSIDLSLYWNFDNRPLQLWRGTAKTHELSLVVAEGADLSDKEAVLAHKRLILALQEPVAPSFGESNWVQKTGVFGPVLEYKPREYPWMEFVFGHVFERWFRDPSVPFRGSTVLDYGDHWNPRRGGQWENVTLQPRAMGGL